MVEKTQEELLKELLLYGQKAKEEIYFNLLKKIQAKEKLTPAEQRTFMDLGKELQSTLEDLASVDVHLGYLDAAKFLAISKRSLSYHVQRGHIKMHPAGGFMRSELERYKNRFGQGTTESGEDCAGLKEKAEVAIRQLRAKREEFLLNQLTGLYISIGEVHSEWAGRVKELATALTSWENALPPLLENKTKHEVRAVLAREVRFLLERFARTGRWTPQVGFSKEENQAYIREHNQPESVN